MPWQDIEEGSVLAAPSLVNLDNSHRHDRTSEGRSPLGSVYTYMIYTPQGVSDFTLIGHAGSREPTNAISKSRLTFFMSILN